MRDNQAAAVPLLELAASVPADFRGTWPIQWSEDGQYETGHAMAPVGRYVHELIAEIARLTAELSASQERERVLRELIQETIELDDAALAELNEMGISHLGHSHTNKLRDALRTGGSDGN